MEQIWRNCKGSVEVVLNSGTEAGPFYYTADLEITTKKGTLTTRSVGVFEGMPFGLGTQFDRVIGGTGSNLKLTKPGVPSSVELAAKSGWIKAGQGVDRKHQPLTGELPEEKGPDQVQKPVRSGKLVRLVE
jgi:hypothetical protein